jgi:hypothetical protein
MERAASRRTFLTTCASAGACAALGLPARAANGEFRTIAQLRAHRAGIYSVHVYELKSSIRTLAAVGPGALEHYPGVRLRVHHDTAVIDSTLRALVLSNPTTTTSLFDARWALIYFGHGGVRLFSAYADSLAAQGSLGPRRVVFNNPIPLLASLHDAAQ